MFARLVFISATFVSACAATPIADPPPDHPAHAAAKARPLAALTPLAAPTRTKQAEQPEPKDDAEPHHHHGDH